MRKFKLMTKTMAIGLVVILSAQMFTSLAASATSPGYHIDVSASYDYLGGALITSVCNRSNEHLVGFSIDFNTVGANSGTTIVLPWGDDIPDRGTIDLTTHVWVGDLNPDDCLQIGAFIEPTIAVGQDMTGSVDVTDLILDSSGADPDSTIFTGTMDPYTYNAQPDLQITSRLLTSGPIVNGTTVVYEITISNVGQGDYSYSNIMNLPFLMPASTSFVSVTDESDDDITLTDCNPNFGPASGLGSGMGAYTNDVVLCGLGLGSSFHAGQSTKFHFTMTATASFVSNSTDVITAIMANGEPDTMLFLATLSGGGDAFDLVTNNISHLSYNDALLQATITRCSGQADTTTDGKACFTVSFNKKIYEDTFDTSVFNLTSGSIVSLTKVNEMLWEVHIKDIEKGTTFALTLNKDSVQDYSAVLNDVHVLGENTIRYEADAVAGNATGAAASTLPETGINSPEWMTALLLLGFGITFQFASHYKKPVS